MLALRLDAEWAYEYRRAERAREQVLIALGAHNYLQRATISLQWLRLTFGDTFVRSARSLLSEKQLYQ